MAIGVIRKYLPVLLTFVVVAAFSFTAFLISLNSQHNSVKIRFDQTAALQASILQRALTNHRLILQSMESLYARSAASSRSGFGGFVQPFESELAGVQALQWVQLVRDEERDEFEQARRAEGVTGYEIRERAADGTMVRASRRAIYYPIYPVQPLDSGEATIGYDLGSDPVRHMAVQQAIASGEATATDWVNLIQGHGEVDPGFLIISPLYANSVDAATASGDLVGLVVGVFRIPAIIEAGQRLLSEPGIELTIAETIPSGRSLSFPELSGPGKGASRSMLAMAPPAAYEAEIPIAGKRWHFVASPAAG